MFFRSPSLRRNLLTRAAGLRPLGPKTLLSHNQGFASKATGNRSEGSIGDAFASLSKNNIELPARFGELKRDLVGRNGEAILDSWHRLLKHIEKETIPKVNELRHSIIPEVEFRSIAENGGHLPENAKQLLKERGTIIVRGLVSEKQALDWKESVRKYIKKNPATKGFPAHDIQVYELYWSKAQLEARAHKNMLEAQRALNLVWSKDPEDAVVLSEPIAYCDRLRMRTVSRCLKIRRSHLTFFIKPGDKSFNLGPHLDGGSLERWEDTEYRKCYTDILQGRWEDHDAFNIGPRLGANVDMYNGPGGCSAFRSYQVRHPQNRSAYCRTKSWQGLALFVRLCANQRLTSCAPGSQRLDCLHSSPTSRFPKRERLVSGHKLFDIPWCRYGRWPRASTRPPSAHQPEWLHNDPHDAARRCCVLALRWSTYGREGASGQAGCERLLYPRCAALQCQRRLSEAAAG